MTGTLALIGGGDFDATDAVDRQLLPAPAATRCWSCRPRTPRAPGAVRDPGRVVVRGGVVRPAAWPCWPARALAPEHVAAVRESPFTYLVGDSPMHLRSVLKDTPLWDALAAAVADGAVVAASGPAAMALCDPMPDPRGGAFTLGLGLARPMAVVPGAEAWSHDRLHRTLGLGLAFPVVTLATGAAVLRSAEGWEAIGEAVVHLAGAEVG